VTFSVFQVLRRFNVRILFRGCGKRPNGYARMENARRVQKALSRQEVRSISQQLLWPELLLSLPFL